jgi:hypothetical protein
VTSGLLVALAVLVLSAGRRPPPRRSPLDGGGSPAPARSTGQRRLGRRNPSPPDAREWARYLDAVAAQIRGGTSVRMAAVDVLVSHQWVGDVVRSPLPLDQLALTTVTDPDEAVVVQTLSTALQLGGATASVVQAGANLLRERAAVRAEARAHSAQARLSARVLTLVPLGFASWSALASATFRRALTTPIGLTSASLGLASNALGWWWMRRIVDRATT